MEGKKEDENERTNVGFCPTIGNYAEQLEVKFMFSKGTIVPNGNDFYRFCI